MFAPVVWPHYRSARWVKYVTLVVTRSGSLWTQKLQAYLLRTKSSKVLHLKPGAGPYIAMHAMPTARDFFLAIVYLPVHSLAFILKPLPSFFFLNIF